MLSMRGNVQRIHNSSASTAPRFRLERRRLIRKTQMRPKLRSRRGILYFIPNCSIFSHSGGVIRLCRFFRCAVLLCRALRCFRVRCCAALCRRRVPLRTLPHFAVLRRLGYLCPRCPVGRHTGRSARLWAVSCVLRAVACVCG